MDAIKKALHVGKHNDETTDSSTAGQTSSGTGAQYGEQNKGRAGSVADQITNPGNDKYDAARFQGDEPVDGGVRHATSENTIPEQRHHAQTGGVLDQIVNPGHEKYDQARFQSQETGGQGVGTEDYSQSGKKEHGVLRQILNPGGDKYDPTRYGTAESTTGSAPIPGALATGSGAQQITTNESATNDPSILRQLANPGGEKYDPTRYAETGTVGSGMLQFNKAPQSDDGSAISVKSGVLGPYASNTDQNITGTQSSAQTSATGGYSSTTGPSTTQSHAYDQSHTDRNAALAGATGLGAGALASESAKHHDETRGTSSTTTYRSAVPSGSVGQTTTSGNTGYNTSSNAPATSSYSSSAANPTAASTDPYEQSTYTQPTGQSDYNTASSNAPISGAQSQSHHGAEAALGGAALGAGGVAAYEHNKHTPSSTTGASDSSRSAVPQSSTGAYASTPATSQPGYQSTSATSQSGYGSAPSSTAQSGYGSAPSSTAQSGYGTAAAAGTGAAIGAGATSYSQRDPTSQQGGLSQHVHNGVSEVPSTSGRHDIGATPQTTSSGQHSSSHSAFPSATETAAAAGAGTGLSHHVYNGLTGKGGSHEPEHHHSTHDRSAATGLASTGAAPSTDRSVSGGAAGYGQPSSTSQYSSGLGASGQPSTSQHSAVGAAPTAQPSSTSQDANTQSSSANPAVIAAQRAAHGQGNTSLPDRSAGQSTGQSEHHYGRDAALAGGAGAVGAGAYEAGKHSDSGPASKTIGPHDSNIGNVLDPRVKPDPALQGSSNTSGPHNSETLNKLDPRVKQNSSATGSQSHTGRDAALAGGAGAAAGAGAYEAGKHHHTSNAEYGSGQQPSSTGYGSSGQQPSSTGYGSSQQPSSTEYGSSQQPSSTGYGSSGQQPSNTGLGSSSTAGQSSSTGYGSSGQTAAGQQYTGPVHDSAMMNKLDPRVKPVSDGTATGSQSHTGRDAALAGGAGAATGAGIYEAEKHHSSQQPSSQYSSGANPQSTSTSTQPSSQYSSGAYPQSTSTSAQPTGYNQGYSQAGTSQDYQQPQQSHTGRDAALGAGAGAATGAGIYEAGKHHDQSGLASNTGASSSAQDYGSNTGAGTSAQGHGSSTGPAPHTIGPHSSDAANVLDPRVQPNSALQGHQNTTNTSSAATTGAAGQGYGSNTGPAPHTIGPHSSDAANVMDPRVQPDPAAQRQHTTTDSSAAAGTAAAAGTTSHESNKSSNHGPQVREDENHHNKLHKEPKEKKEGFLHKIFHHGDKHGDKHDGKHDSSAQQPGTSSTGALTGENQVDPHTGLPINTSLGSGAGGTDANPAIGGYQADSARH